jgi:hypothetical protein
MNLKSGDYPWCILDTIADEENKLTFFCQRCKQTHRFDAKDMTIDKFVEMSQSFCLLHKDCKKS